MKTGSEACGAQFLLEIKQDILDTILSVRRLSGCVGEASVICVDVEGQAGYASRRLESIRFRSLSAGFARPVGFPGKAPAAGFTSIWMARRTRRTVSAIS